MTSELHCGSPRSDANAVLTELLPVGHGIHVLDVGPGPVVRYRAALDEPAQALGGGVSGPTLFRLVDFTAFAAVNYLARGTRAAVLAQSSVSFLESAQVGPLDLTVTMLQCGARSAVTEVHVTDERELLVVSATLHFALPRRRGRPATSSAPS